MSHALSKLHQAAAVATRYQLSTWFLSMHFVEAVLTTPVFLQDADGALKVGIMARVPTYMLCGRFYCTCLYG